MYFKIEYSTSKASFDYSIETEAPDLKSIMTGIESFLSTVIEVADQDIENLDEDRESLREALYSEVDDIIDQMYAYYDEGDQ